MNKGLHESLAEPKGLPIRVLDSLEDNYKI
jgi:hypothetical protein